MVDTDRPVVDPSCDLTGYRIGPYELVELVGRGGFGVVYRGLQASLQRFVAIKLLPRYLLREPGLCEHFQQEIELAAQLDHPFIMPVYDYGQYGEIPYIVMPLAVGGTFRDWLAQGVALHRATTVFRRIVGALEYAHSHGVVHRDI
jgi:eukaryotic-like serine/threonine-protein kinase